MTNTYSYTLFCGPFVESKPTTRESLIGSTSIRHVEAAEEWAQTNGVADVRSFDPACGDWFVMVRTVAEPSQSSGELNERLKARGIRGIKL